MFMMKLQMLHDTGVWFIHMLCSYKQCIFVCKWHVECSHILILFVVEVISSHIVSFQYIIMANALSKPVPVIGFA